MVETKAKIKIATTSRRIGKDSVAQAISLKARYRELMQAHRGTLRAILQEAYAAAAPLFVTKRAWKTFARSSAWDRLKVERPPLADQEQAILHFLRLVLGATPDNVQARDKAGKYARALHELRHEDCRLDKIAEELKKRGIEKLARANAVRTAAQKQLPQAQENGPPRVSPALWREVGVEAKESVRNSVAELVGSDVKLKVRIVQKGTGWTLKILSASPWRPNSSA